MELDQNEYIIGENEHKYMRELFIKNSLDNLSNLEIALFRISMATKNIVLEKDSKYIIKKKILGKATIGEFIYKEINLEEIIFVTDLIDSKSIIYKQYTYDLSEYSRLIKFHLSDKTIQRFVIDYFYLEAILKELKAETFTVSEGRNSDVSTNDILSIFENKEIDNIFCLKKSDIMTVENFNKRNLPVKKKYIKDITLNSKKYFGGDANKEIIISNEYQDYSTEISKYLFSIYETVLFFLGPKGCSKSIFLGLLNKRLIQRNWGKLYINMKYIKEEYNILEIKKTLYKEFLYSVLKENDVEEIYKKRIFDSIKIKSNSKFIYNLVTHFLDFHEKQFNSKLVIIIDNYIIGKEDEQTDIEKIIEYIKGKNNQNYKLIVSGEGQLFNQKIKNYFLKDNLKDENVIFMHLNVFPKFNTKNNNDNIRYLEEEKEYLKKFSFHSLFYCYNYNNKKLSFNEFKEFNLFESFPNYLNIFYEEEYIKFSLASQIFEEALNSVISFKLQENSLTYLMNKKYFPRTVYGVAEELLIILLLKYNKFDIPSLDFKGKNFLEVEEINDLKVNEKNKDKKKIILKENECYLITQKNYNGENYDILIIQKIHNLVKAIFIQIGVDKKKDKIEKHLLDLKCNIDNYKDGIKELFGFSVDEIYLMYIFDEETQNTLSSNGSKICFKNNIDFLVYSFQDACLKHTSDLKKYLPLQYFTANYEVTKKTNTNLK